MPTATELALLVVIIASIEMIIYLMQYILGRFFSEEWAVSAKDNLIALGVLFAVALLIISPVFQTILNVFQISSLQSSALNKLDEIRTSATEAFVILSAINAFVSSVKTIQVGVMVLKWSILMFLDPLDRILDATVPFFTYLIIYANFLYKLMEFFINHFTFITALGAVLLVPKILRSVGASLISFSIAMAVVFPAIMYSLYYVHQHDYARDIQNLENQKSQLESGLNSIINTIIAGLQSYHNPFSAFKAVIDRIAGSLLELAGSFVLDIFIIPTVSFIISLMFSLWLYRLLNMENLEDRIATTFLGIVSMRGRI